MNQVSKSTIDALNHLLSRNIDARNGYQEIAKQIDFPILKKWLIDYSVKKESFIDELKNQITNLSGEVIEEGTFLGHLHLIWVDLTAIVTNNDSGFLLKEAIRGEGKAAEDYAEVLEGFQMPDTTRNILKLQQEQIQVALNDLNELKDIADDQILFN